LADRFCSQGKGCLKAGARGGKEKEGILRASKRFLVTKKGYHSKQCSIFFPFRARKEELGKE
jgi:hypothetical protein